MKTFWTYTKKLLTHACVSYTILTLLLFLIGVAFPELGNALQMSSILAIFGFSILLGGANLFLSIERFPFPVRLACHYPASLLAFFVVFVLIGAKASGTPAILALLLLFTIVYVIVMGVYILASNAMKNAKNESYTDQYRQ